MNLLEKVLEGYYSEDLFFWVLAFASVWILLFVYLTVIRKDDK